MIKFLLILNLILTFNQKCVDFRCELCELETNCIKCMQNFVLNITECSSCKCNVYRCQQCDCDDPTYCKKCSRFYQFFVPERICRLKLEILMVIVVASILGMIVVLYSFRYFLVCCQRYLLFLEKRNSRILNQQQRQRNQHHLHLQSMNSEIHDINSSNQQIETSFIYNEQRDLCAICLESQCNIVTNCDHYFHLGCFGNWLNQNKWCPSCKNTNLNLIKIMLCIACKDKVFNLSRNKLKQLTKQGYQPRCSIHYQKQ